MKQPSDSFRLLLYLEWLLLCLATLSTVLPIPPSPNPEFHLPSFLCTVSLGIMSLKLSKLKSLSQKILFTATEFVLILLPLLLVQQNRSIPFLTVVLVIRGCQMFQLPGQLSVLGLGYGMSILSLVQNPNTESILKVLKQAAKSEALVSERTILMLKFNMGLSFGLTLTAVFLLVNSVLTERQNREELTIAHEKLHSYALRIEDQATLQERNRIAREIHDSLGHTLTAQSIQLENAILFCPTEADKTKDFLMRSKQLCTNALREVRQSVSTLRSHPLQRRSLEKSLAETIHNFRQGNNIIVDSIVDVPQALPPEMNTVVYRIVQEALTNVCKHSAANWVRVEIWEKEDEMIVSIKDNGQGFNPAQNTTGFGLQGLKERVISWGGQFRLVSQSGHGCQVMARLPISQPALAYPHSQANTHKPTPTDQHPQTNTRRPTLT
jgi:signal transduction histidine kinase